MHLKVAMRPGPYQQAIRPLRTEVAEATKPTRRRRHRSTPDRHSPLISLSTRQLVVHATVELEPELAKDVTNRQPFMCTAATTGPCRSKDTAIQGQVLNLPVPRI